MQNGGIQLQAHTDGALVLYLIDNQDTTNRLEAITNEDKKLYPGTWHHVAASYNASNSTNGIKLYIDGVLQAMSTSSPGTYTGIRAFAPQAAKIGNAIGGYAFEGNIAEVAVWKKVLTAEEIKALYHAEDGVFWQVRNFKDKGSKATIVGQSEGVEREDFIQGTSHKTMKTLHKSILPKIKAN